MKQYTTISGDEWDGICFKHYGTEMVIADVMNANLQYVNYVVFPAGIVLNMPDIETVKETANKPPWMR